VKKRRVAVTGMGAVSPFGAGVDLFWRALLDGRSAVRPIERFDAGKYRSRLGAEVPQQLWNDDSLRRRCGNPEEDAAYFAVLAAEEALAQSGLAYPFRDEDGAACIAGTLCAGANQMLDIAEYTALQIKRAAVGKGHAGKQQVQHMVKALLGLSAAPQADAADALACAICHAHHAVGLRSLPPRRAGRRGMRLPL